MDTLETMRIFSAVANDKSYTRAARRLGLTATQASNAVRKLEQHLGMRLLNRTTRSVSITDIGAAYLARCQRLLEDFDDLESSLKAQHERLIGHLRITAPTAYGSISVAPLLHEFLVRHKEISLEIELTDRRISLVEEGFDLAIRLGALEDSTLVCRKLAPMRTVICAAPNYLKAHGKPRTPHDLTQHECLINSYADEPNRWRFQEKGKPFVTKVSGRVLASAPMAIALMAARGLGIAQCPYYIVEEALRQGRLVALFQEWERDDSGVFVLYPPTRYLSARVRGLIDHLAASLSSQKS